MDAQAPVAHVVDYWLIVQHAWTRPIYYTITIAYQAAHLRLITHQMFAWIALTQAARDAMKQIA